jgi:hypothetical protein
MQTNNHSFRKNERDIFLRRALEADLLIEGAEKIQLLRKPFCARRARQKECRRAQAALDLPDGAP